SSYLQIAEQAAAAFPGLGVTGVDILTPDPSQPASDENYIVVEINSSPDIAAHGTAARGPPRTVVADAANLILPPPPALRPDRRRRKPATVHNPTPAALLAAEMNARGFDIDWHSSIMFTAHGNGRKLGFLEAMTDQTSLAAHMVLK